MKRILLVEDSVSFRTPIAAALRRQGYDVDCESHGGDALQLSWDECPDLILLDIAMPGMDGLSCLRELRNNPKTRDVPVIMLTAMAEPDALKQAMDAGVQGYLLKSHFSLQDLLSRVRQTLGEEDGSASPQGSDEVTAPAVPSAVPEAAPEMPPPEPLSKEKVLAQTREDSHLQAVPAVLHRVMALTNSSRSSFDDVADAVRLDHALALKIMRIANSSFFGTGRSVQNLTEAGQRIGMAGIRNTIATILTIEHFDSVSPGGLTPHRFWEHSLSTAVLADLISQAIGAEEAEHVFLAGLMHDIGRLILSTVFPEHYKWVVHAGAERSLDLITIEREMFGLDHADMTREVLTQWQTPQNISEAASAHELSVERIETMTRDPRSVLTIALANRLAHALINGDSGNFMVLPIHEQAKALTLNEESLRHIAEEASKRTQEVEIFYASRSDRDFGEPLANELAHKAGAKIKAIVLAGTARAHPISLLFERLGWLDFMKPTIAVFHVCGEKELTRRLNELRKLEADMGRRLAVLVIVGGDPVNISADQFEGRQWASIQMPARYDKLVETISKLQAEVTQCVPA
jgi:putative nucleotidyltransferase with HDIG domain